MHTDFPILVPRLRKNKNLDCPRSIPWSLIEPHRRQAQTNHYQTIEELAQRGGLDPIELEFVLKDQKYKWEPGYAEKVVKSINFIKEKINEHKT